MKTNPTLDAVIIGGGPAGLAAGLHLARAGYSSLLAERRRFGGQALSHEKIENYPGFGRGVSGSALMKLWLEQARRWGLAAKLAEAVSVARGSDGIFTVRLKKSAALRSRCVLWCAGAGFCKLEVPGENRLLGKGIWNTSDEAPSCAGLAVAVVGSGEAAVQQAAQLARRARVVYLITRTARLKAHRLLLDRLPRRAIVRLPGLQVSRVFGERRLEGLELTPLAGPKVAQKLQVDALFTLIGKEPVRVPAGWRRAPAGFFAAGDAAAGIFRQVAVAGGDGISAAMRAIRYLEDL